MDQNNNEQENSMQQNYNQANNSGPYLEPPMTMGDWLITLLILAIPCVNIVMMFIWGFGSGGNTSRKNYCRAALVFALIGIVISVVFSSLLGAFVASMFNSGMFY